MKTMHRWKVCICISSLLWGAVCEGGTDEARQALEEKQYVEARALIIAAIQDGERDAGAFTILGIASSRLGNHLDATVALETALLLNPKEERLLALLGRAYHQLYLKGESVEIWGQRAMQAYESVIARQERSFEQATLWSRELLVDMRSRALDQSQGRKTEPAPKKALYASILEEFDPAWAYPFDDVGPISTSELALLANPNIVRNMSSASGLLGTGHKLNFYPTYPPARNYFQQIRESLGEPDKTESSRGGTYRFSFYGNAIVISDMDGNVWGLLQRENPFQQGR